MVTKLVQDLIENENVPSVLTVISCWSQSDNFHFMKSSKVPIQLSRSFKISPRIVDDITNKLWYFIDMRCSESYDFLHKIEAEYFAHPYRWILFESTEEQLVNLTLLTDSNVILANFNSHLGRFDLKQGKEKL